MSEVQIEGFNTFLREDGSETLIHGVRIEMCEDTGNYFVELVGHDIDGEFIIDADEFINFKEVMVYLTYLGRDYKHMMKLLQIY